MENILEINSLDDFDYSNIKLSNPSIQTGNNYYTNITIGDRDKPLYIQFPKCVTKAGCVKNNSKSYSDLIFLGSDTRIIKWLENFETYLQNEIYNKRDLWFDTEIGLDDIQELMTPIMRSYRSGKNILVRCNIKNHRCSVYDENEILLSLDNFTSEKEIIPLVCINGIKFSSKNFTIELNLTQIMIVSSKEDLEKNCLIRSSVVKKSAQKNTTKKSIENNSELGVSSSLEENDKNNMETLENTLETNNTSTIKIDNVKNNSLENNILLDISDDKNISKDENNFIEEKIELLSRENAKNSNNDSDNNSDNSYNSDNDENRQNDNGNKIEILDEVDLDSIDTLDDNNDKSHINIREPTEIYYEIYKNALEKANALKKNTIEAFLAAKNIKLKYNLEDLDLNIDLDLENNSSNIDEIEKELDNLS